MRPVTLRCERCPDAKIAIPAARYEVAKPVLEAAGWLPMARKGGKVSGLCPACRPKGMPQTMGRST